jgi:hypothetical protein
MPDTIAHLQAMRMHERQPQRETLLMGDRVCPQFDYYTTVHPDAAAYRAQVERFFVPRCAEDIPNAIAEAAASGERVWIIDDGASELDEVIRETPGPPLEVVARGRESVIRIAVVRARQHSADAD